MKLTIILKSKLKLKLDIETLKCFLETNEQVMTRIASHFEIY